MDKYTDKGVAILLGLICLVYCILIWLGWFPFVGIVMIARHASLTIEDRPIPEEFDLAVYLLPFFACLDFIYRKNLSISEILSNIFQCIS